MKRRKPIINFGDIAEIIYQKRMANAMRNLTSTSITIGADHANLVLAQPEMYKVMSSPSIQRPYYMGLPINLSHRRPTIIRVNSKLPKRSAYMGLRALDEKCNGHFGCREGFLSGVD